MCNRFQPYDLIFHLVVEMSHHGHSTVDNIDNHDDTWHNTISTDKATF